MRTPAGYRIRVPVRGSRWAYAAVAAMVAFAAGMLTGTLVIGRATGSASSEALGRWMLSPGFGGFAAVVAAAIAFAASRNTRRTTLTIAARDRWWDQAKWASEMLGHDDMQDTALVALDTLVSDRAGRTDSELEFVYTLIDRVNAAAGEAGRGRAAGS